MTQKALLLVATLLSVFLIHETSAFPEGSLKLPRGINGDGPNPFNPDFKYVEVNKVNKEALKIPYPGEFYTGYISPNKSSESRIFYQLYSAGGNKRASTVNDSAPLIFNLPGGPGCPAGGSFYEHGPFRVEFEDDFVPVLNEVTWNDDYHLLYLDNPVGVGYSVEDNDMPAFSTDNGLYLLNFFNRFFELFPNLKKQPLYGIGESYGGHFLLGFAHQVINNPQHGIKLTGLGFQGGWFDPYWQGSHWAKAAFAASIVDSKRQHQMEEIVSEFQNAISKEDYNKAYEQIAPLKKLIPPGQSLQNYRNDTEWDATSLFWMNMPKTKEHLAGDPKTKWQCISLRPHFYLDFAQSYAPNVSYILNNHKEISFLFYQGQEDFEVTASGTQTSLRNLKWKEIALYLAAPNKIWKDTNGKVIGQYKHYSRLTYATVNKGGHNTAHDQPWSVKDLVKKWINNKW